MARQSIPSGERFPPWLVEAGERCGVMLVLVGPDWLADRRIDDPKDWVRWEVETALQRSIKVIVVYFGGAQRLSKADNLPESLLPLLERQSVGRDCDVFENLKEKLVDRLLASEPVLAVGAPDGLPWLGDKTDLVVQPGLPLAGRVMEHDRLRDFLVGPSGVLQVRAAVDEAIAFVIEVWRSADPKLIAVHVNNGHDAALCARIEMSLLVVVSSDEDEVNLKAFADNGHHVVLVGRGRRYKGESITLPRLSLPEAAKVFEDAGESRHHACELAGVARRSWTALRSRLGVHPPDPAWVNERLAAYLVMVGAWSADPPYADKNLITELTGCSWKDVEEFLANDSARPEPLFHRSGTRWQLVDGRHAYFMLRDRLTDSILDGWRASVMAVLTETDPLLDLLPEARVVQRIEGLRRRYSDDLRNGIAVILALMGMDEEPLADRLTGQDNAQGLVREVLVQCNEDRSGKKWWSIADLLPLLSEADPDGFLFAVNNGLQESGTLLMPLHQADPDRNRSEGLHSPRVNLLWALEILCWTPQYLAYAVRILANLVGTLGECALFTLRRVFQPGLPYTTASLETRLAVFGILREDYPDVWWRLVLPLSTWPPRHLHIETHTPRFRLWKNDYIGETWQEVDTWLAAMAEEVLAGGAVQPDRWGEVVEVLKDFPLCYRERVAAEVGSVNFDGLADSALLDLWTKLAEFVQLCRSSEAIGTAKVLSVEAVEKLAEVAVRIEPKHLPERHRLLFSGFVMFEGADQLRENAVADVFEASGVGGLVELAQHSDHADLVGKVVAMVVGTSVFGDIVQLLEVQDKSSIFARAYVETLAMLEDDVGSVESFMTWSDATQSRFMLAVSMYINPAPYFDVADRRTVDSFWQQVRPEPLVGWEPETFYTELLKRGRVWPVIHAFAEYVRAWRERPWTPNEELIRVALTTALTTRTVRPSEDPGPAVATLLEHLFRQRGDAVEIARLEWHYADLLQHHRTPRALHQRIARHPDEFVELVRSAPTASQSARILRYWRTEPDNIVEWFSKVREFASGDPGLLRATEECTGRMLAGSQADADGLWPNLEARRLLEKPDSRNLLEGFANGLAAKWQSVRDMYTGGDHERDHIVNLEANAKLLEHRWPRVALAIRDASKAFERIARRLDSTAEDTQDDH